MRTCTLALLALTLCGFAVRTKPFQLRGRAHADLPVLTITAKTRPPQSEANGFLEVTAITIREGDRVVQTISFRDELPTTREGLNPISFEDIDCDGYRDIVVTQTVGVHGDTWERLFRFDPTIKKFVEVKGFEQYPSPEADCKRKILHTYVESGAAGCIYERGTYHWVAGKLEPLEKESQEASTDGRDAFVRTVDRWREGHHSRRIIKIPVDDCHADSPE